MTELNKISSLNNELIMNYPNAQIWEKNYIGLSSNGNVFRDISAIEINQNNLEILICCYKYQYLVKTSMDYSFFIYFIDSKGITFNEYSSNSWEIIFEKPLITEYRTNNHRSFKFVGPNDITFYGSIKVAWCEKEIPRMWEYFKKAQKYTTQSEMELLNECYRKDGVIEELVNRLTLEHK